METFSREQYRRIQYQFVQLFVEHLVDLSKAFEGDLQEMLVLAVIGQSFLRADELGRATAPIGASRIADVTGVPRQTVRRKLQSLEKRGWIHQFEDGSWELSVAEDVAVARSDLEALDRRGVERVVKLVRALREDV